MATIINVDRGAAVLIVAAAVLVAAALLFPEQTRGVLDAVNAMINGAISGAQGAV